MTTEMQKRQQKFFHLKGNLSMAKAILRNSIDQGLTYTSNVDLKKAYDRVNLVLKRFNHDVGWKEKV